MNSFLNPHNGTSLTGVIDITAHTISLYDENVSKEPENIKDILLYLKMILVLLNLMMFRSMNWEIMLLLCTSLLEILMTQKCLDWNHYQIV